MRAIIMHFWFVCFLCSGLLAAPAATHYLVPVNPSAANPYTTWATAGTSVIDVVKAAMTNAAPQIVLVTNGVYFLTNTIAVTNGVVLQSANGRDTAVFNGNGAYRFVMKHPNCVFDALTFTNCYDNSGDGVGGGGVCIYRGTLTNCLVTDCVTPYSRGGGITMRGTGIVANCTVRRNRCLTSSYGGGGIHVINSMVTIMNCIFEYNTATNYGGGINFYGSVNNASVRNCLVRFNRCGPGGYGGGIHIGDSTNVFVANCTIVSNYGGVCSGLSFGPAAGPGRTNIVWNSIICSNIGGANVYDMAHPQNKYAIAYSCSPTNRTFVIDGRGNTTNDPGFIDFTGGNCHFSRSSPCFDSGTNQDWMTGAVDLDGHRRLDSFNGQVDMGCYEYFYNGIVTSLE